MRPPFWLPVALAQLCLAPVVAADLDLPWESVGLSEREAAAHLLNRFTFGPRPGDIDAVVAAGLEDWFESQLEAQAPEPALDARLVDPVSGKNGQRLDANVMARALGGQRARGSEPGSRSRPRSGLQRLPGTGLACGSRLAAGCDSHQGVGSGEGVHVV